MNELITEGIGQTTDMLTVLLQYYNLKRQNQNMIDQCRLNLDKAIQRCRKVYQKVSRDCNVVTINKKKSPFVTVNCPNGYIRYGCCKCVRTCNFQNLIDNDAGKDHTYTLKCKKYDNIVSHHITKQQYSDLNFRRQKRYEFNPNSGLWVRKCLDGFQRIGDSLCVVKCPVGWPDIGGYCLKIDSVVIVPFVWTPGDGVDI